MQVPIEIIWGTIGAFGIISTFSVTAITKATAMGRESGSITTQLKNICQTVQKIAEDITNIDIEFKKNIAAIAKLEIKVVNLEKDVEEMRMYIDNVKLLNLGGTK